MQKEEVDLRRRTKEFALQIVRLFISLPKTIEQKKQIISAFFLLPSAFS
jgi:hypothetical protein